MIELLAVLVLVSILLVLMLGSIQNISNASRTTMKTSKINAIEAKASEYAYSRLNDYGNCTSTNLNLSSCKISLDKLDMNAETLKDPETNKTMDGYVLVCYDSVKVKIITKYYEKSETGRC